jgi:dihydrodipicolinate synthase/N-acetylneuraminate lyase
VVGIKDSQGDFAYFERLVQLQNTHSEFSIAQGRDAHTAVSLFAGARAAVISTANVAPGLATRLFDAVVGGNLQDAMRLQHQLMEIQDLYRGHGGPVGVKSCLEVLGICHSRASQPFSPMSDAGMAAIRETLDRLGVSGQLPAAV